MRTMRFIDAEKSLKEAMKDPAFKKEWDALDAEFEPIHAAIRKQIDDDIPKTCFAKKMRPIKRLSPVLN